jgi:hypothetical protein
MPLVDARRLRITLKGGPLTPPARTARTKSNAPSCEPGALLCVRTWSRLATRRSRCQGRAMRLSRGEIETLAQTFKTLNRHPPQHALFAFASLLADDKLAESIGESFTDAQDRTVWVLTGITDASLIRVRASSAHDGWSWQEPGSKDQQRDEDLAATRWPLAALRSLNVAHVQDATFQGDSEFEWDADWAVSLLGGEMISLPASTATANRTTRERVESLIAVIRSHI